MLALPQALRHLCYRIASLSDLGHRIPLEILAEITSTHHGLLASNSGKKTSTNLGAIHFLDKIVSDATMWEKLRRSVRDGSIDIINVIAPPEGLRVPGADSYVWEQSEALMDAQHRGVIFVRPGSKEQGNCKSESYTVMTARGKTFVWKGWRLSRPTEVVLC